MDSDRLVFYISTVFSGISNSMIKMVVGPWDMVVGRLIFIVGIPTIARRHLYTEPAHCCYNADQSIPASPGVFKCTEIEMFLFRRNFRHCLHHWKLSFRQLPVRSVTKILVQITIFPFKFLVQLVTITLHS